MRIPSIEKLANTKRIRRAAIAIVHKRTFSEGYSYPSGRSALQGYYDCTRRSLAVREIFDKLENAGLVRFEARPDDSAELDNLLGDVYNPVANPDIKPEKLAAEKQTEIDRINREGVCGIVGEYRVSESEQWENADSVWGFVGDDWKNSGYDTDIMASTIAALKGAVDTVCPHCGRPRNAKRAHKH